MRRGRLFWSLLGVILVADAITKWLAESRLAYGVPRRVVGDLLQLTLTYNRGAVFGIPVGDGGRILLIAIALGVLTLLFSFYRRTEARDRWRVTALALLCAGAVGNLIDRFRSARGVVDFIDVGLGSLRFWTFNVADMAVTVGAIMLALSLWREESRPASNRLSSPPRF